MKGSGVGGGRNLLNYKQMKMLMKNYPLDYLEWEILIVSEDNLIVKSLREVRSVLGIGRNAKSVHVELWQNK